MLNSKDTCTLKATFQEGIKILCYGYFSKEALKGKGEIIPLFFLFRLFFLTPRRIFSSFSEFMEVLIYLVNV